MAARSISSISANSAGSSSAFDAPCRTSSARTRSRTRPCSSAMTCSVITGLTEDARLVTFGSAGTNRQRRRRSGNDFVLLLDAEGEVVIARKPERVVGAVTPLDGALARFVRLAVLGVLGHRAVVPVPLHGGAVEVGVIVWSAFHVDGEVHTQRGEASRRV